MEIGSEYELNIADLEMVGDSIFSYLGKLCPIYTNSGRSAARLLNEILPKGKILMPNYICQSVIDVYKKEFSITYYQVKQDFTIDVKDLQDKIDNEVVIVYLMHYFGKLQNSKVLKTLSQMREKYHYLIIEDTTHSLFTNAHTIGDFCVCSLRKWFPIPDGGVVYSPKEQLNEIKSRSLPQKVGYEKLNAMILKYNQIYHDVSCNNIYRTIFRQEEERLNQEKGIYGLSHISNMLLKCLSIEKIIAIRKGNLRYLLDNLKKDNVEIAVDGDEYTPLVLPCYVDNRDDFRSFLIDNHIFCAVHWPIEDEELKKNGILKKMADRIISLPLDQRYDKSHMKYMTDMVTKYWEE